MKTCWVVVWNVALICLDSILIRKEESEMITLLSCNHVFCTKWRNIVTKHVSRVVRRLHLQTEYLRVSPSQHRNNIPTTKEGIENNDRSEGENCFRNVVFFFCLVTWCVLVHCLTSTAIDIRKHCWTGSFTILFIVSGYWDNDCSCEPRPPLGM